jgi:adenylate cyclase
MAVQAPTQGARDVRRVAVVTAWVLAALLPLAGLVTLMLRAVLDPHWSNSRVHFTLFLTVGAVDFALAYVAGDAARRRGDARVLLISLAFLVTGGFLALHAVGSPGVLFSPDLSGFKVAIPIGLIIAAAFALASAFVDVRPGLAPAVVRRQVLLRRAVIAAIAVWFALSVIAPPPLDRPVGESATGTALKVLAGLGSALYAVAAARYFLLYRRQGGLLPVSVIACFVLLAEAMIGVALTGERAWHASWWTWHALIVLAFVLVAFAARREWRQERFRALYLDTTRERSLDVSVLFSDLAGYTTFCERHPAAEANRMLAAYYALAAPLIARFGGEIEHFTGDGIMATFNTRGDQPDHALRAARASVALAREMARLGERHPEWPRLRVGVNTGRATVRELGGHGHVAYSVVGDSVNVGARLESSAPVGGVLIGAETYRRLPAGADAEAVSGLRVRGRDDPVDAFVLRSVP